MQRIFHRLGALGGLAARKVAQNADRHRDNRRWQDAASNYRQALSLDPRNTGIWVQYGHALKEQGQLDAAEEAYRQAQARGLDDADIFLQIGHVLKLQDRLDDASDAYAKAFERDHRHPDTLRELRMAGWTSEDFRAALPPTALAGPVATARNGQAAMTLAIDICDILQFLGESRRPTGIQRVQLTVVGALLDRGPPDCDLMLVSYSEALGGWVEIEPALFRAIGEGMSAEGSEHAPEWRRLLGEVAARLTYGREVDLPAGAYLVNLGSSWAFPNYFLALRHLRAERGIVYVPLVHDCIPLLFTEYFTAPVQRDFREWMERTLLQADGLMANSNSTQDDVSRIAAALGVAAPPMTAVRLDATFQLRDPATGSAPEDVRVHDLAVLQRLGLADGEFVLCVGTIEPRKNHIAAFEVWSQLIAERGSVRVPPLVCAGRRGWRSEPVLARLDGDPELAAKVRVVHGLTDTELAAHYRACRFTIYPSRYEGWGLPVTESLSLGRLPLVSRVASLPEAGGDLAEYFDPDDRADLKAKLTRLLDDDAYLAGRTQRIAREFRPRAWSDIAEEMVAFCRTVIPRSTAGLAAEPLPYATFAKLARDPPGAVGCGVASGEGLRRGRHWGDLDEDAAWLSHSRKAALSIRVPNGCDTGAGLHLHVLITARGDGRMIRQRQSGRINRHLVVHVGYAGEPPGQYPIESGAERWITIALPASPNETLNLDLSVYAADGASCPPRTAGVVAVYLCSAHDAVAQRHFLDGVMLNSARYGPGALAFRLPGLAPQGIRPSAGEDHPEPGGAP